MFSTEQNACQKLLARQVSPYLAAHLQPDRAIYYEEHQKIHKEPSERGEPHDTL
jgi:hypothetical protein